MDWKIYYNPRCGTCREVLEILDAAGIRPDVVEYLEKPLSSGELDKILKMGGFQPEDIVRKKEEIYAKLGLDKKKLNRAEWLAVLSRNPILIQRPIVVKGKKAILARPPEKVKELL